MAERSQDVWLGVATPAYEAAEGEEDAYFCKIGGEPRWLFTPPELPRCIAEGCGRTMALVAQMSCPLHEFDRVLHIFACNRTRCQMRPGSWRALRAQQRNAEYAQWYAEHPAGTTAAPGVAAAAAPPAPAAASTFAVDDDWGDDGGELDADGFGGGGFGEAAVHSPAAAAGRASPAAAAAGAPGAPGAAAPGADDEDDAAEEDWAAAEAAVGATAAAAAAAREGPAAEPQLAPAAPAPPPVAAPMRSHRDPAATKAPSAAPVFPMTPVDTVPEPEEKQVKAKKYTAVPEGSDGKGGGEAEGYEKGGSLAQRAFLKFQRRIAREPAQVLRWSFAGEPLSIDGRPDPTPPPCPACGAGRVPEAQVLATALEYLRPESCADSSDESDVEHAAPGAALLRQLRGLSFGTATLYTCGAACDPGPRCLEEHIVLRDEPDFGPEPPAR
eukprot:TRINITY_DN24813_c0_g1_i1.p1 TRINITY_DN24813_c0_g1~~TRINITY_DN24813_c0_g1_i1.p1  ORF type:complete len:468 (+),score=104.39 TRINITY_DN24813_c0_g1_i1:83-1405(+)